MKPDNDRGFMLYGEVTDSYGAIVQVKESSADPLDKVWIFINGGPLTSNDGAAHMTIEQLRDLRTAIDDAILHKELSYKEA